MKNLKTGLNRIIEETGIETDNSKLIMPILHSVEEWAFFFSADQARNAPCFHKDKVRLLPALNIPMDILKKAAGIILAACGA